MFKFYIVWSVKKIWMTRKQLIFDNYYVFWTTDRYLIYDWTKLKVCGIIVILKSNNRKNVVDDLK